MKKSLLVIGMLAIAAVMNSCGGNGGNTNNAPADNNATPAAEQSAAPKADAQKADKPADAPAATQAVDLTKKYICPNRDGSSDTPGVCEACGMDLIENN
ncbi:MAG: hypothetical protein K6F33_04310 [Bacteroidales bacterium]|nr:hypothetical protein [Bacteroidales bacterium]